ncbi:MAG: hypothetical protein D6761_06580 [Candidatus Dadabacteria bacterium]|nr:MAG: hypothetical protein D6761_06580 [Candidatus Dadabacteria bacterium]
MRTSNVVRAILLLATLAGCQSETLARRCGFDAPVQVQSVLPDRIAPFAAGASGHGSFGLWFVDRFGLPAYRYTLDQMHDGRALWPNTEQLPRRDHWHLVGNLRINALAYNHGYVEVFIQDRGLEALNRFDPASGNFAGGFSVLSLADGRQIVTADRWKPAESLTRRVFGMGYATHDWCDGELRVERNIWAPQPDAALLVDDVAITNLTGRTIDLEHVEVWDVNRHAMPIQLVRSGSLEPTLPARLDAERDALNEGLTLSIGHDGAIVRAQLSGGTPVSPPTDFNPEPFDTFVADLSGIPDRVYADPRAFWAEATRPVPAAGRVALDGRFEVDGFGQAAMLAPSRNLTIAPGETVRLRYAFGYTEPGAAVTAMVAPWQLASEQTAEQDARALAAAHAAYAVDLTAPEPARGDVPDLAALRRELAWHSYYLRNAGGFQQYFEHFIVNQGSAYWYKHGLDGAVRDFMFIAAPLSYIDPALAREVLLYAARMRHEDRRALSYAVGGYGQLSDAGIHTNPSDVDLFLWWGIAEYVAATGDQTILDAMEPWWPKDESASRPLWRHIEAGVRRLIDDIGVGAHGLIHVQTGDWDDSITFFAEDREQAEKEGESVANAMMAARMGSWAAAMLEARGATTAANDILTFSAQQRREAAEERLPDGWYRRAWFGPNEPFGEEVIFLFSNALALIADLPPTPDDARELVVLTREHLSTPSTTGMFQFHYFSEPANALEGATDEGSSNPAISALAIWGFAHADRDAAWIEFLRNTMARKADVYPDIWYGIWSGPDAQYTNVHPDAGQTWASVATPTRDFPIINSNQHVGPLLGALRVFGIEPVTAVVEGRTELALGIAPKLPPGGQYALDLPLMRVDVAADGASYSVTLRSRTNASRALLLGPPPARDTVTGVELPDGVTAVTLPEGQLVRVPIVADAETMLIVR